MFGLWQEAGVLLEKPPRHWDMLTPHSKASSWPAVLGPDPFCCAVTLLTTWPLPILKLLLWRWWRKLVQESRGYKYTSRSAGHMFCSQKQKDLVFAVLIIQNGKRVPNRSEQTSLTGHHTCSYFKKRILPVCVWTMQPLGKDLTWSQEWWCSLPYWFIIFRMDWNWTRSPYSALLCVSASDG